MEKQVNETTILNGIIGLLKLTIGPFLLIWALNTLCPIEIVTTFWTWLAVWVVIAILG